MKLKRTQVIQKRLVKSILWLVLTPFLVLGLTIGLIHLPPIQNLITTKVTDYLTEGTGYRSEIEYVNIRWFNSITADGTVIYDHNDNKMIAIEELVLTFDLSALLGKKDFNTKEAWIYRADVNLRNEPEGGLNIDDWAKKITELTSSSDTTGQAAAFLLAEAELIDSRFSIADARKDSIEQGFNYNQFQLININADLLNLKAVSDTFQVDVKFLTAEDKVSGFKVEEMKSYFRYSNEGMHFLETDLKAGKSRIKDDISFYYDGASQMAYFIDSINVVAKLNGSVIHTDELSYFVPDFKRHDLGVSISGDFQGYVHEFTASHFEVAIGDNTRFNGSMDIEGLPNTNETFFDISFDQSIFSGEDFSDFLSGGNASILSKFGQVNFNGQFDGFLNDFVADGLFETEIGTINSNVQINLNNALPTYSGYLDLRNFNLGEFTEDPLYQMLDLSGSINGKGFKLNDANFNLVAEIKRFGLNNYEITNIETDGAIAQSFFSGELKINDPNLTLFANGSIDLRDQKRLFNITGSLEKAWLDSLNLTQEPVLVSSDFNIDLSGLKIDSLAGNVELLQAAVDYNGQQLDFDTLSFNSTRTDTLNTLIFESNHIDFQVDGDFKFTVILGELVERLDQYTTLFAGDLMKAKAFNTQVSPDNYFNISYAAHLKNIDPILHLLDSNFSVADNSTIAGTFIKKDIETFSLEAKSPSIRYKNNILNNNEFYFSGENVRDLEQINIIGYIYSDKQTYGSNAATEDLTIEAIWDGTHIDFRQNINQYSSGNYAEIGADLDFFDDRIELSFEDSNIIALEEYWQITDENKVVFTKENISIEHLKVSNKDQSLSLDGAVAIEKDSSQNLNIDFKNVQLKNINPITAQAYEGVLNGELIAQNILFNPLFLGQIEMLDVQINDFPVGDIKGEINWNDPLSKFELDFDVVANGNQIIQLSGDISPSSQQQLNLFLELNRANLQIAEPYISEYFTEIGGVIDGQFIVGGRLSDPQLEGNGLLSDAQMKINYLNTLYSFDGGFEVQPDSILLNNIDFLDAFQNSANFSGVISHDNYNDFRLDLNGDMTQFQVMNLPTDLDADFYGEAYATGTVSLIGEASNLTIAAKARTEENTEIFIPITKSEKVDDGSDYIRYIDRSDTIRTQVMLNENAVDQINIEGLTLDLDIEVTPEAQAQIIIDARTGDIIRGRGNGQLRLVIDSNGDFQMTGGLDIAEGAYNFSLYSIINKEFQIEQPSNITWFGDPYAGVMSIKAAYNESTPINPILEQAGFGNINENNPTNTGRRVPVKVLLDLQGPLLSPEITFDIDFGDVQAQDYETVASINAFKNKIQTDEQELNRQVLSLILLGKFSDQGNVNIVGGTTTQSVSQLLSNQLSQLVAQLDENLEVDFDLRDLNDEAFNTMRLRLSYTFLEGRLRVTREGGLSNIQTVSSAVGDWTAEYLLTPDGRYKVKIYYRSNYDYTAGAISQTGTFTTQGASITQTSSFNSFGELFKKVEKSREAEKKAESDNKPSGSSNQPL